MSHLLWTKLAATTLQRYEPRQLWNSSNVRSLAVTSCANRWQIIAKSVDNIPDSCSRLTYFFIAHTVINIVIISWGQFVTWLKHGYSLYILVGILNCSGALAKLPIDWLTNTSNALKLNTNCDRLMRQLHKCEFVYLICFISLLSRSKAKQLIMSTSHIYSVCCNLLWYLWRFFDKQYFHDYSCWISWLGVAMLILNCRSLYPSKAYIVYIALCANGR